MILGVDVSLWQGTMNWQKAEAAGARFAFIRVGSINNTSGNCYADFQFANNAANCHLERGFYWYFRVNHNPLKQADFFAGLIESVPFELPPVCDFEESAGLTQAKVQSNIKAFLDRVQSRLGATPAIYTRTSIWNFSAGNPSWAGDYPLWIARYTTIGKAPNMTGPWDDGKFKPSSWDTWEWWQFSADKPAPGNQLGKEFGSEGGSIDLNVWNRAELPPDDDSDLAQQLFERALTAQREALEATEALQGVLPGV